MKFTELNWEDIKKKIELTAIKLDATKDEIETIAILARSVEYKEATKETARKIEWILAESLKTNCETETRITTANEGKSKRSNKDSTASSTPGLRRAEMSEPTVFYGEKKVVWVDIPTRECVNNDEECWENLVQFETREEAVAFIREHIDPSCDDEGRICLLTESH